MTQDGGAEWYLLKDTSDVEQFIGSGGFAPPTSLPVMAAYTFEQDGQLTGLYVYPKDVKTFLGYFQSFAPGIYRTLVQG
jgi:hypothetical protein